MKNFFVVSLVIGAIALAGNWVGYDVPIWEALPGMLIIFAVALAGYGLGRLMPKVTAVVWVSLLGLLVTSPIFPYHEEIFALLNKVNFMAIATPTLAYVGLSLGKDLESLKSLSWRIVVVSITVFTGTFVISGLLAEITMRLTGSN
jgi:hypothetical protein